MRVRITIEEHVTNYRVKEFDAESIEDATAQAESDDWTTEDWEDDGQGDYSTGIYQVQVLDDAL